MSELFDPLLGASRVVAATGDPAWLRALCATESALARACGRVGLLPPPTVAVITAVCEEAAGWDVKELGHLAVAGGNPAIPLVVSLRERARVLGGDAAAAGVHLGATSQDILDSALMLVVRDGLSVVGGDLEACGALVAGLAGIHRMTPMIGRTLLQQAVPTTFGALAAVWGNGLDHSTSRLATLGGSLPASLGGAGGTLNALHPHGLAVLAAFSEELGLAEPAGVWHTDRGVIAELAGALGRAGVAVGKVATDIVLLAQSEVGELREASPGGSSAMAHKQNAIAAVTARASAAQAPGFVATVLASGAQELQRGAGPWHAERGPLIDLLRAVGGASGRLRDALGGLRVDTVAMLRNLGASDVGASDLGASEVGAGGAPDVGHAPDLVDRYLLGRRTPA